jgi:hypothetical protein
LEWQYPDLFGDKVKPRPKPVQQFKVELDSLDNAVSKFSGLSVKEMSINTFYSWLKDMADHIEANKNKTE